MSNIQKSATKKIHLAPEGNVTALEQQHTYTAPLPTPIEMAGYEQVKEGFAERMMIMAEKEQDARLKRDSQEQSERLWRERQKIEIESSLSNADSSIKKRGQWFALGGVSIIASLSAYAFYLGHPTAGASIAGTVIVALAGVFIYQSKKSEHNTQSHQQTTEESPQKKIEKTKD